MSPLSISGLVELLKVGARGSKFRQPCCTDSFDRRHVRVTPTDLWPKGATLRNVSELSGTLVDLANGVLLKRGDCDSIAELLDEQRDALLDPELRAGE